MTEFDILVKQDKQRLIARLQRMVVREGDCYLWAGAVKRNGYGCLNFRQDSKHVQFSAHRVFMTLMLCAPIPADKEVGHHTCFNRRCVKHIKLETRQENLANRRWLTRKTPDER